MRRERPAHLRVVPIADAATPRASGLLPDVEARVIALPDSLRAWAREEPLVWFYLNNHVAHGVPLAACVAEIVRALGEDGLREVRVRLADCPTIREVLAPHLVRRMP